jgi:hypothetical protein
LRTHPLQACPEPPLVGHNETDVASCTEGYRELMLDTRRIWFPLRSNIAYFDTSGELDIKSRVKQMALLADEVWFEPGMMEITQAPHGVLEWWTPPDQLSEERIRDLRAASIAGQPIEIRFGIPSAQGVPSKWEDSQAIITGDIGRSFVAEYHLLAQESGLDDVPWVAWPDLTDDFVHQRDFPKVVESVLLDGHLRKGLNRDLAVSAAFQTPAAIDELHRPILEFKTGGAQQGVEGGAVSGTEALHLWAPNFTDLPWKRIIELHDHDAIGEFRAKLAEAEEQCANLSGAERSLALKLGG